MKISRFLFPFVLIVAACSQGNDDVLIGTLERDRIEIPAVRSEPVVALHVREGARVNKGDHLLQLDSARAMSEWNRLEAERVRAQRRLDELLRGPREERILEARARLSAAQGRMRTAEAEFARIRALVSDGLASRSQLDRARAEAESTAGERDAVRAALEELLEGTTTEVLDQARADLTAATAAMDAHSIEMKRLSVKAPVDATVESLPWKPGSQPPAGKAVVVLLAAGNPFVRTYVPVSQRNRYTSEQNVRVHVPGFGEFDGHVRWVSSSAAFTPYFALTAHDRDRLSHATEIELQGDSEQLRALPAGLPVEVISNWKEPE